MSSKKPVVVLDGGTGSSLAEMGFQEIEGDPLWSALVVNTSPQAVVDLHKAFLQNGADVVVSATYQASIEGHMKRFGLSEAQAADLITEGVNLARRARNEVQENTGRACWVAGSVGPYGAILCDRSEYNGRYAESMSIQELTSWHIPRLAAILKGQPDILAIETIPVVKEVEAILESLKKFPGAKAWVSYQCKDGGHTGHGENIRDAMRAAVQSDQVVAVGVNCTSPSHITPILQAVEPLRLTVPILVKPNRGCDSLGYVSEQTSSKLSLAEMATEWIAQGASMVGGCCEYNPGDIGELRRSLEARADITLCGMTRLLTN
ncbi:LOW QUALITY PROTEIN: uncharacterized protein LOC112554990 [Pomacea canaliculata]|uniref:LOW QUALITY PROTEIN: uncharacterized protein LOC112554990 n=1 Tax=Pomacea canaliculata TaxID=400727 RepID=UPI000D72905F|nr:LOW QUALITY PROTEIN: uncharacterized protein LOC112554990 [Pomacea canaliculata]